MTDHSVPSIGRQRRAIALFGPLRVRRRTGFSKKFFPLAGGRVNQSGRGANRQGKPKVNFAVLLIKPPCDGDFRWSDRFTLRQPGIPL
jgi:hypothetical protein